jgi:hypothetical protein
MLTWSRALLEVLLSLLFALTRAREGAGALGWCEAADGANYAWASPAAMGFNALAAPDSVISIRTWCCRWP